MLRHETAADLPQFVPRAPLEKIDEAVKGLKLSAGEADTAKELPSKIVARAVNIASEGKIREDGQAYSEQEHQAVVYIRQPTGRFFRR